MAEQENTTPDPLEEAFNAPAAEGHPEAESVESPEEAAEAVEAELQDAVGSRICGCGTRRRAPGLPASPAGRVHQLQEPHRPRKGAAASLRNQ